MSYRKHLMPSDISPSAAYEATAVDFDTDTISRQAAINALETTKRIARYELYGGKVLRTFNDVLNSLINIMSLLPSTQPEPHWIPVTERLPDISESVLICDIDGDIYLGHRTRYGDYYPDFWCDKIKNIVAWQPLPEPYKGVTG